MPQHVDGHIRRAEVAGGVQEPALTRADVRDSAAHVAFAERVGDEPVNDVRADAEALSRALQHVRPGADVHAAAFDRIRQSA